MEQLVIHDVYKEVKKAFDHHFNIVRMDFKEFVSYYSAGFILRYGWFHS